MDARSGLAALEAAGALERAAGRFWDAAFTQEAAASPLASPPKSNEAAEAHLEQVVAGLTPSSDQDAVLRAQAAMELYAALGVIDWPVWDARLRVALGDPTAEEEEQLTAELNTGGTEVELLEVLPGPAEVKGGFRLLFVLRFVDGVAVVLDVEGEEVPEWPEWRLEDDVGTDFWNGGSSGSSDDVRASWRTPVPPAATRLVLSLAGHPGVRFKVPLAH